MKSVLLLFILVWHRASAYKIACDEGWTGFSESSSCYLIMHRHPATFQDAKASCENYDARLAIVDTVPEKDHLATMAGQITRTYAWLGLTHEENGWRWLDGSEVNTNVIHWSNKTDHGCGTLVPWGALKGMGCEDTLPYICEKPLGTVSKCGEGWEKYGDSCYKRYHHEQRPWDEARSKCTEMNSDLIVVNSHAENNWLYEFANRDHVDVWLGLRENKSENKYVWVNGIANEGEGVIADVWEQDEPKSRDGLGSGMMSSASNNLWSTRKADEKLGFVCEKPTGNFCPFDLRLYKQHCYDFIINPDAEAMSWDVARDACSASGLQMITIEDYITDEWITKQLYQSGIFSRPSLVNGMWIGYYETQKQSSLFRLFPDNITLDEETMYDARRDDITYTDKLDCLFLTVCPDGETEDCSFPVPDEYQRWDSDECANPSASHIQGCRIKKGLDIDISNLMHPKKYCPDGWGEPFADNCYLTITEEKSWGTAEAFCAQNVTTATLVNIFSPYENNMIKKMAKALDTNLWIGLTDKESEGTWIWADETPLGEWKGWGDGEPNGDYTENCVEMTKEGGWNDRVCSGKNSFVCKVAASNDPNGNPVIPDSSTMPPTTNCGYMGDKWVENPNTGMCYSLVTDHAYTWQDATEYCKEIGGYHSGGNLASIGDLDEQKFFNNWLSIEQYYESVWVGLSDLNKENSFKWSDGTPFAFMNWRDTEPNGGEGENCVEFRVDQFGGQWNDYICKNPLHFVCEKKGDNYVEPPNPPPVEPQCPEGWKKIRDRCIYLSSSFGSRAKNWTEAKQICKGFHEGSTLISIRDQADSDSLYNFVTDVTYLGGSDAMEEGTWVWEDGEAFTYTNWGDKEPNGGNTENCLEMDYYMNWNDIDCGGNTERYFICSSPIRVCPASWFYFDRKCWYFSNEDESVPWQAAQDLCKAGSEHANLISIHSETDNAVAQDVARGKPGGWIGLQINAKDDYTWIDNSNYDYNNWKQDEPNNMEAEKCAAISPDDGTWSSENCEESKSFTCNFKTTHYISCPSGWEKYDNNCYLLQPEVNKMVFEAAEEGCVNKGGHLVSIASKEELKFLKSFIASYHQCGNDWWTLDPVANKCYYHSTEKVSWFKANESCVESDSTLVKIGSAAKNSKLLSMTTRGTSFWAGANDLEKEGVWKWLNSDDPIDCENSFCDWNPTGNEPNGGPDENCLQVWNEAWWDSGHWNDASCEDNIINYVCEKKPFGKTKKTYWIGLNDLENTQTVSWTDGTPVSFVKWDQGQPFHHSGDQYKCVAVTEQNKMTMVDCSDEYISICKRPAEITSVPPDSYGCAEGQFEYEGSCYEFFHEHRTFISAENTCQDNGGNLIAINDENEQDRLVAILAETFGTFFIGLKYVKYSSSFEWTSGDPVSYTDAWDHSQPDLNLGEDKDELCTLVSSTGSAGYWFISTCDEPHSFICEFPRNGYTNPPTTTTTVKPEAQCENFEWTKWNDHCYRFFTDPLSFNDAESFCQSKGGSLASMNSAEEENQLSSQITYSAFVWIGQRQDENGDEGYYWTDGSPLDFTNYKSDQPDDLDGTDNCIVADWQYYYSYGWESHNCESQMPFVCEVLAGIEPPTTAPPPTVTPPRQCTEGNDDGWVKMAAETEFCYKVFQSTEDTWESAEYNCQKEGGHLASIHDPKENAFVMNNLAQNSIQDAFVGLFVNNDNQFEWSDGTIADYFAWNKGEPNNHMGLEGCVEMYSGTGHWNDAYCSRAQSGYACKRQAEGEWTTPRPTDMPEGHCPEDTFEYKGYCYKFVGFSGDVSEHRNWTEARKECLNMGPSYDLVSIHNQKEQAFISTVLAEHDTSPDIVYEFWIGFHDFVHWNQGEFGTFVWSDQSLVSYVNWAANEPNGADIYEGICVEMWAHDDYDIGHWNDHTCENVLPYICKSRASLENPEPPITKKCKDELSDWDSFGGDCYKWMSDPVPWLEAEQICQENHGAHLVSILKESEEAYALISAKGESPWIGLSDSSYTGYFKWSDGWPMQISNWGQYPSLEKGLTTCVAHNISDGKWYASDCEEKRPYLCKHSDKKPPTPSPNGECHSAKFIDLDQSFDSCYYFAPDSGLNWGEAQRECAGMGNGAILVTIHSKEESDLIAGEIAKTGANVWIGLFATVADTTNFKWLDNSAVDFTNWEDGEPNGETEYCAEMYGHNGKWNDAPCDVDPWIATKGHICKAPKIHITTADTPKPTSEGTTVSVTTTERSTSEGETTETPKPTSTETPASTTTTIVVTPPDNSGMSGGTIAIVVIVCLIAAAGGAVFLVMFFKRDIRLRKLMGLSPQPQSPQTVENLAYDSQLGSSSTA